MKKILLLVLLLSSISLLEAQMMMPHSQSAKTNISVSITPFAGYTFSEKMYLDYYGGADISDGLHYGASLEIGLRRDYALEFYYQRQDATINIYSSYYPAWNNVEMDASINYYMIGGLHYMVLQNEKLKPFFGLNLGAVVFGNSTLDESETRFAVGIKAGLKVQASPAIGFIGQAQLLSTVSGGSSSVWIGTDGVEVGAGTYSSILQFGLTGGISINLNEIGRK